MANKRRKKKAIEEKEGVSQEKSKEKQAKQENKILRNFFIIIIVFVAAILLIMIIYNLINSFDYKGVEFETVKFCDAGPPCLILYKTSLPVKVSGNNISLAYPEEKTNDYNFYLRNDPRDLNVDFNGEIIFKKIMVLNFQRGEFICEGNGAVASANFVDLYKILGTQIITDENATCDPLGRYTLVNVVPGNETRIDHYWPACYTITIKDCEIFRGTEKFMIETFLRVDEILNNQSSN